MLDLEDRIEVVETRVDRLEGLLGHFIVQTEMLINRLERQQQQRAVQLEQRAAQIETQLEKRAAQLEQQADKDRQQLKQADERWQQRLAEMDQRWEKQRAEDRQRLAEMDQRWEKQRAEDRQRLAEMDQRWEKQQAEIEQRWEEQRAEDRQRWAEMDQRWEKQRAEIEQRWEKQRVEDHQQLAEMDQRWEKQRVEDHQQLAEMDQRWEKQRAEDRQHWNKRWGELAQKMGTIAEDIVAPNLRRIARVHFGCQDLEDFMIRRKVKNKQDPSKRREFDVIAICADKVLINETKSTPSVEATNDFVKALAEVTAYFPEYQAKTIIPIFASLYLDDDLVNYLTKQHIYALAMGEETMELLNGPRLALTEQPS